MLKLIITILMLNTLTLYSQELKYSKSNIQKIMQGYELIENDQEVLIYKCKNDELCYLKMYEFNNNNRVIKITYVHPISDENIIKSFLNKKYKILTESSYWINKKQKYLIEVKTHWNNKFILLSYVSLNSKFFKEL